MSGGVFNGKFMSKTITFDHLVSTVPSAGAVKNSVFVQTSQRADVFSVAATNYHASVWKLYQWVVWVG